MRDSPANLPPRWDGSTSKSHRAGPYDQSWRPLVSYVLDRNLVIQKRADIIIPHVSGVMYSNTAWAIIRAKRASLDETAKASAASFGSCLPRCNRSQKASSDSFTFSFFTGCSDESTPAKNCWSGLAKPNVLASDSNAEKSS